MKNLSYFTNLSDVVSGVVSIPPSMENCIVEPWPWGIKPYQDNYHWTTITSPTTYESHYLTIDKVENGWIVNKNGKKYIVSKPEELLEYLKD